MDSRFGLQVTDRSLNVGEARAPSCLTVETGGTILLCLRCRSIEELVEMRLRERDGHVVRW
ncbi:MAG TPA: hypothetical protein VFB34_06565 [Chloroflexota bacterium]|nr:hypothetical protein [Chloroflexota bacterium]